jgi:hypothetical protein
MRHSFMLIIVMPPIKHSIIAINTASSGMLCGSQLGASPYPAASSSPVLSPQ